MGSGIRSQEKRLGGTATNIQFNKKKKIQIQNKSKFQKYKIPKKYQTYNLFSIICFLRFRFFSVFFFCINYENFLILVCVLWENKPKYLTLFVTVFLSLSDLLTYNNNNNNKNHNNKNNQITYSHTYNI